MDRLGLKRSANKFIKNVKSLYPHPQMKHNIREQKRTYGIQFPLAIMKAVQLLFSAQSEHSFLR